MKIKYLILFIWVSNFCFGQLPENKDFSPEFRDGFTNSKWMDSTEYIELISEFDISKILVSWHHNKLLGYIGTNYQRIEIRFISIIKDYDNPKLYYVFGKSRAKNNIVDFQGTLELISAKKYSDQYFNDTIMGSTLGKYVFFESPNQDHVGMFEGYFISSWLLDKSTNTIDYDDIHSYADGFSNNEFVGTWTPYGSRKFKTCNWGEWRIPYSRELDQGAGHFSPREKFRSNGWQEYYENRRYRYEHGEEKEAEKWWK